MVLQGRLRTATCVWVDVNLGASDKNTTLSLLDKCFAVGLRSFADLVPGRYALDRMQVLSEEAESECVHLMLHEPSLDELGNQRTLVSVSCVLLGNCLVTLRQHPLQSRDLVADAVRKRVLQRPADIVAALITLVVQRYRPMMEAAATSCEALEDMGLTLSQGEQTAVLARARMANRDLLALNKVCPCSPLRALSDML